MHPLLPQDKKPLILVAEDDVEDRFIMTETFIELGHADAIHIVENGIDVLKYLQENGAEEIKLIILDLNMPKLNGTEVLGMLQEDKKYAHISVVIFSTSINQIEMKNCMELGAKEYIAKPVKYAEYLATCKKFYEMASHLAGNK